MRVVGREQAADEMAFLRLLQLADSALPIGATAHSFGLETLTDEGALTPQNLERFFTDYLHELGALDASFCRAGYHLAGAKSASISETWQISQWLDLNNRCGAWKPARESRIASATLGRRLLQFAGGMEDDPFLRTALESALAQGVAVHHAPVFGLIGGVFGLGEEATVAAYLQQTISGLLSACQKLLPLGQNHAAAILWRLKPSLLAAAQAGVDSPALLFSSAPSVEMGGMRHAHLPMRLFIS